MIDEGWHLQSLLPAKTLMFSHNAVPQEGFLKTTRRREDKAAVTQDGKTQESWFSVTSFTFPLPRCCLEKDVPLLHVTLQPLKFFTLHVGG